MGVDVMAHGTSLPRIVDSMACRCVSTIIMDNNTNSNQSRESRPWCNPGNFWARSRCRKNCSKVFGCNAWFSHFDGTLSWLHSLDVLHDLFWCCNSCDGLNCRSLGGLFSEVFCKLFSIDVSFCRCQILRDELRAARPTQLEAGVKQRGHTFNPTHPTTVLSVMSNEMYEDHGHRAE